jgi:hypothetical protein
MVKSGKKAKILNFAIKFALTIQVFDAVGTGLETWPVWQVFVKIWRGKSCLRR